VRRLRNDIQQPYDLPLDVEVVKPTRDYGWLWIGGGLLLAALIILIFVF
jgi:hypothetical protein